MASLDKHEPIGILNIASSLWPNTRSNQSGSYEEVLAARGVVRVRQPARGTTSRFKTTVAPEEVSGGE